MIYGHIQSTGAYDTAEGLSDLFNIFSYMMMTFRISIEDEAKLF